MEKQNKERIDLKPLELFCDLTMKDLFPSKKVVVKDKKNKPIGSYLSNNLISVCILRIRETSQYLNQFQFRKKNEFGEAFDFYEMINCISIIKECVYSLFKHFKLPLKKECKREKIFSKSNKKKTNDFDFFNFIRSASSVHPQDTTRHSRNLTYKHEFFPYAYWKKDGLIDKGAPDDYDIKLISWNSNPKCGGHPYYLYMEEFFEFANYLVSRISDLNPCVQSIIEQQKEKIRCKRLMSVRKFSNHSEYCLYLRGRLKNKNKGEDELPDGGLLIASHILSNDLIGKEFKRFIFQRVQRIAKKMKKDITKIGYDDTYEGLCLYDALKDINVFQKDYVSNKFYEYLEREALYEIENNSFQSFKPILFNGIKESCSDAEWAASLLFNGIPRFYDLEQILKADSYADLFEITLERIWLKKKLATLISNAKKSSTVNK